MTGGLLKASPLEKEAALCARAGIAEYWVVDLSSERLLVHREPVDSAYASLQGYASGEAVAPLSAPGQMLAVAEIFPGE